MTEGLPERGEIAFVRQRRYLVENVTAAPATGQATLVELSCLDDDAQGEQLAVLWEHELDARVVKHSGWSAIAEKGFDDPPLFAAYLRTLSWNCVTATDPKLFQAPFRAGIRTEIYQLEPLSKALQLPRVNLFIADDVGVGKTIEAGLIARELLLRRRIDKIVVACPPSMLDQWHDEMESRFGLVFTILDRAHVTRMRRERGFSVNPWMTHSRFLVSHRLLIDEAYASGLRDWLGDFAPQSLLILDEAHHAAPSSGARYAIDSQTTRAVRDIAPRFEHRLFLSATPHNGHRNSFSALLEILDPQRFCRGVPVRKGELERVMVRRMKSDLRAMNVGFPKRIVEQVDIKGLPSNNPELVLAEKLEAYRQRRDLRLKNASRSQQSAGKLVVGNLQKRLLSSIDAFARTLAVHRRTVVRTLEKAARAEELSEAMVEELKALTAGVDADVDLFETSEGTEPDDDEGADDELTDPGEAEMHDRMARATAATSDASEAGQRALLESELALVDEMRDIAEASRYDPDARIKNIVDWIDENMCPVRRRRTGETPRWNERRVIIFTEYEDTRRYIERCLGEAIAQSDQADARIATFTGVTSRQRREEIKHAFNTEPSTHPLRILIATDAAREGLNLQRHCHDLYHFDLPWNPSRLDQRNGRIDRKLQPADEVFCRYFFYHGRPEDKVLQVLVRKAEQIRHDMGSVAKVLEGRVAKEIEKEGIRRDALDDLADAISSTNADEHQQVAAEELEEARSSQNKLQREVDTLRGRLDRSRQHIGLTPEQLRQTLSMSLRLAGAPTITAIAPGEQPAVDTPQTFTFPGEDAALAQDSGWTHVLDTLRGRRQHGESLGKWRQRAPVRPVAFEDTGRLGDNAVQLHLEHRVAQRLLSRFTSQGLIHHDLSKACLTTTRDAIPRVILLGRLAVYGERAARLHEEIVAVTARWTDRDVRGGALKPFGRSGERTSLASLQAALDEAGQNTVAGPVQERLLRSAQDDIADLVPHLKARGRAFHETAKAQLHARAEAEGKSMRELLLTQRERIMKEARSDDLQLRLALDTAEDKQRAADRRAWDRRLEAIESEFESEPKRVEQAYTIRAWRIDPLGLVYLWPRTG